MEKTIIVYRKYSKELILDVAKNISDGLRSMETIHLLQDNTHYPMIFIMNPKEIVLASINLIPIEDTTTSVIFNGYSPKQVFDDSDDWVSHTMLDFLIDYIKIPGAFYKLISTPITSGKIPEINQYQVYQLADEFEKYLVSKYIFSRIENYFKPVSSIIPPWEKIKEKGHNREVLRLCWSGYTKIQITKLVGIEERSVYRILQ